MSLIIIFVFLSGFYFYYIPSNKETQNKYAFLILQNMQSDLESKFTANISMLANNLKKYFLNGDIHKKDWNSVRQGLGQRDVEVLPQIPPASNCWQESIMEGSEPLPDAEQGQLYDISNSRLVYLFHKDKDSIALSLPFAKSIDEILQAHQDDFFQSFLFLKTCNNKAFPVFISAGLSLGSDIALDSLLIGGKGAFYPDIADLRIEDINYKMFYLPANINGRRIIICGFKKTTEYLHNLYEIPPGFIYPIVITLLLLLIILPLIKLYIMGPDEKVRVRDFAGYCFSLLAGGMFITIIIIQVILLKDGDTRMKNNLHVLSQQIDSSFQQELLQAYRQLKMLDTLPERHPAFTSVTNWRQPDIDVSDTLLKYLKEQRGRDSIYYNFDRISWANNSGLQIIKGSLDKKEPLFINVSQRGYFKALAGNGSYRLPGIDTAHFAMEPVFNWVNGDFRIVVARRSDCPHAFIVTLSTNMYSVNHTVLPTGFGFCIIDAAGNVQVHSDSSHNLNENFFDELEDAGKLKAAISGRQELFVNGTKFYGKKNGFLMTPISNLPFFLVTFYDKGYILPVNMRILVFSLLFCVASFLICLFIWRILYWRRYYSRPLLLSPMDYLRWVIPKKKNTNMYFFSALFLAIYVLALLLFIFLPDFYVRKNNHFILILLLLTPLNITCGLKVIRGAFAADSSFLAKWRPVKEEKYLVCYTVLTEMLVICLSVMPAALFTWYSHNHEILQAEKKEQLFLATSLENRKNSIFYTLKDIGTITNRDSLYNTLQYHRGIYSINEDVIVPCGGRLTPPTADSVFDTFYFEISDRFSNEYYDPQSLPALRAGSADHLWQWGKPDSGHLRFTYTMQPDDHFRVEKGRSPLVLLNIRSRIPQRYIVLKDPWKFILLLVIVIIIILGLYKLIRRVSEGIFLQKFIRSSNSESSPGVPPMVIAYCLQEDKEMLRKPDMPGLIENAVFDYSPLPPEQLMNQEEHRTILQVHTWKKYYAYVFGQRSPYEKYLLCNFASDGLLNYKNVADIYQLLRDGILVVKHEEVRFFSAGFRAYILQYATIPEEVKNALPKANAWESFKKPFMLMLFAVAALIFFTQQEIWQRISALITGLSTSLPLLFGLFRSGPKASSSGT
jgi:hypothetical protein